MLKILVLITLGWVDFALLELWARSTWVGGRFFPLSAFGWYFPFWVNGVVSVPLALIANSIDELTLPARGVSTRTVKRHLTYAAFVLGFGCGVGNGLIQDGCIGLIVWIYGLMMSGVFFAFEWLFGLSHQDLISRYLGYLAWSMLIFSGATFLGMFFQGGFFPALLTMGIMYYLHNSKNCQMSEIATL